MLCVLCVCVHVQRFICLFIYMAMHAARVLLSEICLIGKRDSTERGWDTLFYFISAHATYTVLPALLGFLDQDLDRKCFTACLTPSYPSPSPICLHADLSALYLYQVIYQPSPSPPPPAPAPPESARIDTASRWLSARSTHLLVCVSRLLWVQPLQPPPLLSRRVCILCLNVCAYAGFGS